jgi:hypothetical protein
VASTLVRLPREIQCGANSVGCCILKKQFRCICGALAAVYSVVYEHVRLSGMYASNEG